MNETELTLLKWTIFFLAFGGMVLIHEFGHFIVARLFGIEVEEFGVGLPTPGALTLWTSKGYLILKDGRRIEIPHNFPLPLNSSELIGRQVKITADSINEKWVLRSMEVIIEEPAQPSSGGRSALEMPGVYVDQNGNVVGTPDRAQTTSKVLKVGKESGETAIDALLAEVHPGTRFTFNWLPFGGFVRPKGENDPKVPGGLAASSPWKRLAVLFAGPLMNLLAAVIIYAIIFSSMGVPDKSRVLVVSVTPDSPAAQGGLRDGDIFISGNGQAIQSYEQLRTLINENVDTPVNFVVDRKGQQIELSATPRMSDTEDRALIGVGLGYPLKQTASVAESLGVGVEFTGYSIRALISLPAQLIRGTIAPEQGRIIGLKGIFDILGQSVSHDIQASNENAANPQLTTTTPIDPPFRTLELLASLTISLGVFNLFPFPALDGGRIIFILPELIFRRRVSPRIENLVHGLGMAVLLIFMLYVNVMDFINPVTVTIP